MENGCSMSFTTLVWWIRTTGPVKLCIVAAEDLVLITPGLSPELLLRGYASGCFPWSGKPARWYCPNPRAVFQLDSIRFPQRLRRQIRQRRFEITYDQAFEAVITACASEHQSHWIDAEIVCHYLKFHQMGFAHSVEVWDHTELVGGLYGVQLKKMFAGESMFFRRPNASKIAFFYLVEKLRELEVRLFDSQVLTPHTQALGATEIPRSEFLQKLRKVLEEPGEWAVSWTKT